MFVGRASYVQKLFAYPFNEAPPRHPTPIPTPQTENNVAATGTRTKGQQDPPPKTNDMATRGKASTCNAIAAQRQVGETTGA
jgi:hypothetical protein